MSNRLDTTSTVTLVINGEQSKTSLRDITTALNAVRAARARMNQEEDPARYQELIRQEQALTAAQRARRNETNANTSAIQNETTQQKKFFDDFKEGFSEISELTGKITAGALIYKGINFVLDGFKSLINGSEEAFKESDLTQTALQNKLRQTGNAAGENIKKLQDLQKAEMNLTGVDDDVIAKGEDMLLTFTNVRGRIYEQSIPAIVDYAAALNNGKVTMEGIQSAAETLGKGLDDLTKIKKTAKAMDVTLTEEEYNQIEAHRKNNEVMEGQQIFIDALKKRYGDLAQTLSETETGSLQRYETRLGNIQEVIGQWIVKGKSLWAQVLSPFLGFIEDVVTSKLSDTMEDERIKMNLLVLQITDANTKQDERVKLINKLKEMYPDYLKDLDAEKTSNEKIVAIGEKLNDVYINRIILAKKDEELEKQNQTTAELRMKRLELETQMREKIISLHKAEPELKIPVDGTTFDKLNAMVAQYATQNANNSAALGVFGPIFSSGNLLREYQRITAFSKMADDGVKIILTKRQELIKELGIDEKFTGATPDGGNKPPEKPVGGETDAEKDARIKAADAKKKAQDEAEAMSKEFTEKIIQFNAEVFADTLDKNDKEVEATKNKFNALITTQQAALEKYKANKYANDDDVKKHEEEIRQLSISRDAAVNQIKERQAQDLEDKIAQLRDRAGVNLKNEYQKEVDTINDKFDELSKDAGDNQDEQNRIYYERLAALADARIRLEKQLQEEIQRIKDEGATTDDEKKAAEIAKLNLRYNKDLDDLKKKYGNELEATKEYQDAKNAILANKKKAIDHVNNGSDDKDEKEKAKQQKQFAIDSAQTISNSIFEIGKNRRQAETDAELADIDRKRDAELSNENLTAEQRSAIQDKYAKQEAEIKRKAWEADKQAALSQAIINGALAVVKALPNFYLAAAAGVAAAAQIITISSEKAPEFGYGGIINGPSHANGGVDMIDTQTGRKIANVEGGEPMMVLSKDTYANNRMLINELLYNSQYRNGAPVSVNTKLSTMPATGIYRDGGIIDQSHGAATAATKNNVLVNDNSELIAQMKLIHQAIQDQEVIFNDRLYEQFKAKKLSIRNRANAA